MALGVMTFSDLEGLFICLKTYLNLIPLEIQQV